MRAKQALRPCVMLLVACPLAAAVAQPHLCDELPAFQEFARAIGACRDPAPIIDVAPPTVKPTPSPALPVPNGSTEATTVSPGSPQATKLAPQRTEARKPTSKATSASARRTAPSKTAGSRKSEGERRNEPLDQRAWKTNETLELPNLTGRSYADAANVLTEFKVERVEVASAAPTGEVLAQDPAPGSSLPPGSPITLRVSDGSLASAAAAVPAPSAASVAPASQLEPSTAPVQNDRVAGAFIGASARNVVAALVAGVLLGLLFGAVLMRRALLARGRAIDTAPAEPVDIAPAEIDSGQAAAEVHSVAAIEPPPELKFTAWLDPGKTTVKFTDLPEDEEAAIEYLTDQYGEQHQAAFTPRNFRR